jgi:DNA-binding NtrC family response regulator
VGPGGRRHEGRHDEVGEVVVSEARAPLSLRDLLRQHERLIIVRTLQVCGMSRKRTAETLQVTRNQLWRRMRDLEMDFKALSATRPGRPRRRD